MPANAKRFSKEQHADLHVMMMMMLWANFDNVSKYISKQPNFWQIFDLVKFEMSLKVVDNLGFSDNKVSTKKTHPLKFRLKLRPLGLLLRPPRFARTMKIGQKVEFEKKKLPIFRI